MSVRKTDTADCQLNRIDGKGYLMDMSTGKRLLKPYVVIGNGCVNCSSLFTYENFKIILQNLSEYLISTEVGGVLDIDANDIIESAHVCKMLGTKIDIEKVKRWIKDISQKNGPSDVPRKRRVARVDEMQYRLRGIEQVMQLKDSGGEGVLVDAQNRLVINRYSRTYASLVAAPRNRFIAFIVLVIIFFTTKSFVSEHVRLAETRRLDQQNMYTRFLQNNMINEADDYYTSDETTWDG